MSDGVRAVIAWLRECGRQFEARAEELNELDRTLGDGDHGTNMRRGFEAAESLNLEEHAHAADALRQVGMALVSNVGGASGPLFGTFLLRAGANWPSPVSTSGVARAVRQGLNGVVARGKAEVGDKTMVDAIAPAAASLERSAAEALDIAAALSRAADAAEAGRDATASMVAQRGRAHLRAAESVGVLDPGAVSMSIILRTAASHIS